MRHRVSLKKLSKTPAHRKAMIRNMLVFLYRHEKIKTTFAKSKVLQRNAERLITRAKQDSVHNRRMVARWVQDKEILNKLFTEISPKYMQRQGGYTRIVKLGPRYGDATEMVYISLVEEELPTKKKKTKKKSHTNTPKREVKNKSSSLKNEDTKEDASRIEGANTNTDDNTTLAAQVETASSSEIDTAKESKSNTSEESEKSSAE